MSRQQSGERRRGTLDIPHVPREQAPRELLELFYPIHYTGGMKVEDTLRSSDQLNRQQAIILWLIHSEGRDGRFMPRKDIQQALSDWYEITNSSISKALRSLAKPPLELLTIEEHPDSGREKVVRLTGKGQRFVKEMVRNGTALTRWFLDHMTQEEVDMCIYIYRRTAEIFDRFPGPFRADPDKERP